VSRRAAGTPTVAPRRTRSGGPAPPARAPRPDARALAARVRAGLRTVPRAAWLCAAVACLNAACWSVLSPPFEVPDEPSHYAYVARLAETGSLPTGSGEAFTRAEMGALSLLRVNNVRFDPSQRTISTPAEQRRLEHVLAAPLPRAGSPQAGVAASQPPLYYALETIPYLLASSGTVLDRLALMRLCSALLGGVTALFVFLFLREALPAEPWAWTVGGLGVALAPLLGMMSGAVNPDALLTAVSAALFWCLARGFRRGLTPGLAAATGGVVAAGLLTKLTFASLVPGAALGVLVLCVRAGRAPRRAGGRRPLALAGAAAAGPVVATLILAALPGPSRTGTLSGTASAAGGGSGSLLAEASYVWQFYLPRLPGMTAYFHGFLTTRTVWFDGLVGLYGWLDTTFPSWVYTAALLPAAGLAALLARALYVGRRDLRRRAAEVAVYACVAVGLLVTIGAVDYQGHLPTEYAEPRYLLPLLALWGAALALAARGAGRRWGPVAGALIVALFLAHDLFSGLLVISRYYG
jgi:hypothetical protein